MNNLKLERYLRTLSPLRVVPIDERTSSMRSMRTSERNSFRSCRRNWWFSSENQLNLEPKRWPVHFWLGTGFHYAMEYHYGHKTLTAQQAFDLFYRFTTRYFDQDQLEDLKKNYELGRRMIEGFVAWHDRMLGNFTTAKDVNGAPLVEVNLQMPLGVEVEGRSVYYSATIDRVVQDRHGDYWIVDYKTASKFNTDKLGTDPQISAYYCIFEKLYGIKIAGMIYIQVLKAAADPPQVLNSGKLSKNKMQNTSAALYKEKCRELFGNERPEEYAEFIDFLESQDGGFETKYFRADFIERTAAQIEMQWQHMISEAKEMFSPDLAIYPNFTRDCMWMCSFRGACEAIENQVDWQFVLSAEYKVRDTREDSWRADIQRHLSRQTAEEWLK